MSFNFGDTQRPSTGRQRVLENVNHKSDTALWGPPPERTGVKQTRTYKKTSLWATSSETARSTLNRPSVTPRTSLWATSSETARSTSTLHRSSATPRTSLWGTINENELPVTKPPPVKPAPYATSATTLSVPPPPPPPSNRGQPFATNADIVPVDVESEKLRASLTYDLEERYRQAADAFIAADVNRSGFLEEEEILRLCHLFNLPVENVVKCFNLCDTNQDKKMNYKEFTYHLLRPSFSRPQQQTLPVEASVEVPKEEIEELQAPVSAPVMVPVSAPLPSSPSQLRQPSPPQSKNQSSSAGVAGIFGGPDGAPTPPLKSRGRSRNRNYNKTSLW